MEPLGTFDTAESDGQSVTGRDVPARADDAHTGPGAQRSDRLPDATGADHTHGLAFDQDRPIGAVLEFLPPSVAVGPVQAAREM